MNVLIILLLDCMTVQFSGLICIKSLSTGYLQNNNLIATKEFNYKSCFPAGIKYYFLYLQTHSIVWGCCLFFIFTNSQHCVGLLFIFYIHKLIALYGVVVYFFYLQTHSIVGRCLFFIFTNSQHCVGLLFIFYIYKLIALCQAVVYFLYSQTHSIVGCCLFFIFTNSQYCVGLLFTFNLH